MIRQQSRRLLRAIALSLLGFVVIALFIILALGVFAKSVETNHVVATVLSPDAKIVARLVEHNAALSDPGYKIILENRANGPDSEIEAAYIYKAKRNDCSAGANLYWSDIRTLEVTYKSAKYTRREEKTALGNDGVLIRLRSGVEDPHAPCGGYMYKTRDKE